MGRWWWMWTPPSARSTATTSRAPATATLTGWATTPLLATRADSGEVLHARLRKGSANTARGVLRFVDELVARCRRAGAVGELTLRMDSGFWSAKLIKQLRRHQVRSSITVRQTKTIRAAIAAIPEAAWVEIGLFSPIRGCLEKAYVTARRSLSTVPAA